MDVAGPSKNRFSSRENSVIFDDSSFFANISYEENKTGHQNDRTSNTSVLNISALCCDEEIGGYDRLSGRTWIYPTNYPVRDYQFNIIKSTILNNTLVSLPTGLGKTFIAAVVMYNFYRWYPLGKIVFTAPTRPLVAQQIHACYNIVAIPKAHTVEMTGHMQVATRKTHWKEKRVFFATPQVIYNDLKSGTCPAELIRCLVFDEAHRAKGNYAYCQIVSTLQEMGHRTYRVLALSATPGSKVDDVVSVVKNLQIARLELRTENCIDVASYSHSKKIHTVVIPLGSELNHLRQQYVEILDDYTRRLRQLNILSGNMGNLSKGRIIMLYKEYQCKDRGARHPQHNNIMRDFTILISLYHGLELLSRHGSRVFLNFFDEHTEKTWMQNDDRLTVLLERLRDDLGINPLSIDRSTLPDGTIAPIPRDIKFGHPKFERLREIMTKHFNETKQKETKAIVFCEYRESVHLVHCLLLQCRPLIQPQMFVGQGASGKEGVPVISQKAQLRVMRQFRSGACNTLVATCVAEEGLDVGSVDLIVCFDISSRSPVRLVQRCGRTGRERGGQVYILVTEGREHQTLQDCMRQRDNLNSRILKSSEVNNALYKSNPRMMPQNVVPECRKMHITVDNTEEKKQKKSGQKDLRTMLTRKPSKSSSTASVGSSIIATREEYIQQFPQGPPHFDCLDNSNDMWTMSKELIKANAKDNRTDKLSEWLEWQRTLQSTGVVAHSRDSEILSELLQFADNKRFQLQSTDQRLDFNTQLLNVQTQILEPAQPEVKRKNVPNKKKTKAITEPTKKDGDIRALFSTTKKSTKEYTKVVNDLRIENETNIPTSLIDIFVDLCVQDKVEVECEACKIIDCEILNKLKKKSNHEPPESILIDFKPPDISLLDNIDLTTIEKVKQNLLENDNNEDIFADDFNLPDTLFTKHSETLEINSVEKDTNNVNYTSNFDLEFDFDFEENNSEKSESNKNVSTDSNFNIGCLDDIFDDSNIPSEKGTTENTSGPKEKEALEFFGLGSIDDIFADSDIDDAEIIENSPSDNTKKFYKSQIPKDGSVPKPIQIVRPTSPSLLANTQYENKTPTSPILCSQLQITENVPSSPVLCSQQRHFNVKSTTPVIQQNCKKTNCKISTNSADMIKTSEIKTSRHHDSTIGSKSLFSITQVIDMINQPSSSRKNVSDSTRREMQWSNIITNQAIRDRSTSPIICSQVKRRESRDVYSSNNELKNYGDLEISQNNKVKTSPIIFTQPDRIQSKINNSNKDVQKTINESVVVLDSDSDNSMSCSPENKAIDNSKIRAEENSRLKRQLDISSNDDTHHSSPFFNKRLKLNNSNNKKSTLSLKDKIKSIFPNSKKIQDPEIHTAVIKDSTVEKENRIPLTTEKDQYSKEKNIPFEDAFDFDSSSLASSLQAIKSPLEKLEQFRRHRKSSSPLNKNSLENESSSRNSSDSEDEDFKSDKNHCRRNKRLTPPVNFKVRKKRDGGVCEFLELSAELSGASRDSGEELTDESVGSVADFICDETHHEQVDMLAHYLRSVKSPVNGKFKIPALPKNNLNVLSQPFVNDDNYEMDSFCVDGNVGLTQAQDVSELELAERKLRRMRKKKRKNKKSPSEERDDASPIGKPRQFVRRVISSESESDA